MFDFNFYMFFIHMLLLKTVIKCVKCCQKVCISYFSAVKMVIALELLHYQIIYQYFWQSVRKLIIVGGWILYMKITFIDGTNCWEKCLAFYIKCIQVCHHSAVINCWKHMEKLFILSKKVCSRTMSSKTSLQARR